jgi:Uma2 family endonuclease
MQWLALQESFAMATTDTLLTAEEYRLLPDSGQPSELVRGRIVMMNMPGAKHGLICNRVGRLLANFVEDHDLGVVFNNDAGVVTEHGPDTVRGADVAFYSYQRIPKGGVPDGYPAAAPEIVFEVRSPGDRRKDLLAKTDEYLAAGVLVVCIVDPKTESVEMHVPGGRVVTLTGDQQLTFPEILPGFSLPLQRLFQ